MKWIDGIEGPKVDHVRVNKKEFYSSLHVSSIEPLNDVRHVHVTNDMSRAGKYRLVLIIAFIDLVQGIVLFFR